MPVVPAGDLTNLRTTPQRSRMYMVVQQPLRYDEDTGDFETGDALWFGTVQVAPATDPIFSLTVTADGASPTATIPDRATVLISSSAFGYWDRAIICTHGDQTINGAGAVGETLYIAVTSELSDVQVGDKIVVLDEFQFWLRFPKITESGGDLTWYKDYGYFENSIGVGAGDLGYKWSQLGANDGLRREACLPPVPIMSSHAVAFIDPDVGSVDIDFDWTDSYATYPGASVNAWASEGETDHIGGTWNDNVRNPAAKTYSTISGRRGFRVTLEILTDETDPITEFCRGVRYVFTLRRPWEAQAGDPDDACPLTDFAVESLSGDYEAGGWRASIRVFASQAHECIVREGALVILFTEDWYGSTEESIGPDDSNLTSRENIVMVGYVGDGSIKVDSETGETSFEILSLAELMKQRENYPVPIENHDDADEWYKCPDLTIDRAAHHWLCWHTNLRLIADCYQSDDTKEIAAQDFLAENAYNTVDDFLWDRIFARFLCDRFGRTKFDVDVQMGVAGAGTTMWTLATGDWIGELSAGDVTEKPVSTADLGGLVYNAGNVTPYLSHAPGEMSAYRRTPFSMTSLAISSQANLNTLAGRMFAYKNNRFPRLTVPLAGNWRVGDVWPQEYVVVSEDLIRHTFSSDKFIARAFQYEYDSAVGALLATYELEMETDGPDGQTIVIPEEPPPPPPPPIPPPPPDPPEPGTGGEDAGRRIITTDVGVFVTDNIGASYPNWYAINSGLSTADQLQCYGLARDPWLWWNDPEGSRRLWVANHKGIWKMENFPGGTWTQVISDVAIRAFMSYAAGGPDGDIMWNTRMDFSIETSGRLAFATNLSVGAGAITRECVFVATAGGSIVSGTELAASGESFGNNGYPDVGFAQHSGGSTLYTILLHDPYNAANCRKRLYKTSSAGATWTQLEQFTSKAIMGKYGSVSIPYLDATNPDSYVLWGSGGGIAGTTGEYRISTNQGHTFAGLSIPDEDYSKLGTASHPDKIWLNRDRPDIGYSAWTNDGGVTWNLLPDLAAFGVTYCWASHTVWSKNVLQSVVIGVQDAAGDARVYYWRQGLASWVDKTGNLLDWSPTEVRDVDRDSSGAP